jgi:hypothetical protein
MQVGQLLVLVEQILEGMEVLEVTIQVQVMMVTILEVEVLGEERVVAFFHQIEMEERVEMEE